VRREKCGKYETPYYVTPGDPVVLQNPADTVVSKGYHYYKVAVRHQLAFEATLAYI
jgi:hypothetical protein